MKYLGINLTKEVNDLHTENYKTLFEETGISCSWTGRINITKTSSLPKAGKYWGQEEKRAHSERVTGRKGRDLPREETGCKCQTSFLSLKQQEETKYTCLIFSPFSTHI